MPSTRKIVAIGAVLAMTAAGVALAETTPGDHSMGPDHMQHAIPSGQPVMGPGQGNRISDLSQEVGEEGVAPTGSFDLASVGDF
jgi:hypothetical protein